MNNCGILPKKPNNEFAIPLITGGRIFLTKVAIESLFITALLPVKGANKSFMSVTIELLIINELLPDVAIVLANEFASEKAWLSAIIEISSIGMMIIKELPTTIMIDEILSEKCFVSRRYNGNNK